LDEELKKTRSTGTGHTFTKARLASVAIWIRDPDLHQNLIICSLAHCQPSLKISCKAVQEYLCKVANRQTNDDYISLLAQVTKQWPGLIFLPSAAALLMEGLFLPLFWLSDASSRIFVNFYSVETL